MARAPYSEAQHRWTASRRSSSPRTLRNVSCCPAKLASGRSSAVALDRTATTSPFSPIRAYASTIASLIWSGIPTLRTISCTSLETDSRAPLSSTSRRSSLRKSVSSIPVSTRNLRNAWAVTTNAFGTGRPREVISPRDAPFPPTEMISSFFISSSHRTLGISFMLAPHIYFSPFHKRFRKKKHQYT